MDWKTFSKLQGCEGGPTSYQMWASLRWLQLIIEQL